MKIAIIGTGGVGGYFGGRLAKTSNEISFLARGKHLKAMKENGLIVKSLNGDFVIPVVKASDNVSDLGLQDLILVCVKAWQLKDVAPDLKKIMHKDTVILPLENGITSSSEMEEALGKGNVLGGLCRIISKIESPGVISHVGIDPEIIFGEFDNTISPRVKKIKEIFDAADIKSIVAEDITAEIWKKFMGICISGLMAVTRTTYGELRELSVTRKMMTDLMNEIYDLALKAGVNIRPGYVDDVIAVIDSYPYESSTSLARDVWEGRPSEIEYQNGTVIRFADRYGIEVPVNRFVYNCIFPMELKARKNK
jgi:2-dehydropantoate 2-reductase